MECIENNADNVKKAVQVLKKGDVIAHPADTCFGLAADLMNERALKKLQQIKGREAKKPMSIMLPDYLKPRLSDYDRLDDFAKMVCEEILPGPVTIVLPKGPKIPACFFPEMDSVGIRIPCDPLTEDLLTRFRGPLITTSANLSGKPVCCRCSEVISAFKSRKHKPDLLLKGEIRGACLPSTVISLENDKVCILRPVPVKKEELETILGIRI